MAVIAGFDHIPLVGQPIEQCGGHLGSTKYAAPLTEAEVGGDYRRDALIELADQMEEQRAAVAVKGQVTLFVKNDDILVDEPIGQPTGDGSRAVYACDCIPL